MLPLLERLRARRALRRKRSGFHQPLRRCRPGPRRQPITLPESTRASFVAHCCPVEARPYYFAYRRDRRTFCRHPQGGSHASMHYDLAEAAHG